MDFHEKNLELIFDKFPTFPGRNSIPPGMGEKERKEMVKYLRKKILTRIVKRKTGPGGSWEGSVSHNVF